MARRGPGRGEILLHAMFRLLQVVKIHQANNKLFSDNVKTFREVLQETWNEVPQTSITLYRGRFYMNDERMVYTPSMWTTSAKMMEFFQERNLNGIRFLSADKLDDKEIVDFMSAFNSATRHPEPAAWLEEVSARHPWVKFVRDKDQALAKDDPDEEGDPDTMGKTSSMRGAPSKNISRLARQVYSQTLTAMRNLVNRLLSGKIAGIQKSKRAVQELIDLMFEDEAVFLSLSTIRDRDDQLFTHSVNVAVLVVGTGRKLGLSRGMLEHLGLSGLFHDLGKANLAAHTARPERLEGRDLEAVRNHSLASVYNIIRLNAGHSLKQLVLGPAGEHHMGVDRSGYPKVGNPEEPLSLFGRIIAVADQYDALTSSRPWRPEPFSPRDALLKLMENAGKQLDPVVLKSFVSFVGPWPAGSVLILDTHEIALARHTPDTAKALPQARLLESDGYGGFRGGELVEISEIDPLTGKPKRNIISSIHPDTLSIQPVDFLLHEDFD
ncbi:MAG: HD domain-containing protein [Deltaproteobacteria bacterium]|jgi:HD-GYP domain-containing protein (c-di-GMP phosphodiesterase class II)|nr:HD domain-containing protein [Deltaproteobacteria bacterium]